MHLCNMIMNIHWTMKTIIIYNWTITKNIVDSINLKTSNAYIITKINLKNNDILFSTKIKWLGCSTFHTRALPNNDSSCHLFPDFKNKHDSIKICSEICQYSINCHLNILLIYSSNDFYFIFISHILHFLLFLYRFQMSIYR